MFENVANSALHWVHSLLLVLVPSLLLARHGQMRGTHTAEAIISFGRRSHAACVRELRPGNLNARESKRLLPLSRCADVETVGGSASFTDRTVIRTSHSDPQNNSSRRGWLAGGTELSVPDTTQVRASTGTKKSCKNHKGEHRHGMVVPRQSAGMDKGGEDKDQSIRTRMRKKSLTRNVLSPVAQSQRQVLTELGMLLKGRNKEDPQDDVSEPPLIPTRTHSADPGSRAGTPVDQVPVQGSTPTEKGVDPPQEKPTPPASPEPIEKPILPKPPLAAAKAARTASNEKASPATQQQPVEKPGGTTPPERGVESPATAANGKPAPSTPRDLVNGLSGTMSSDSTAATAQTVQYQAQGAKKTSQIVSPGSQESSTSKTSTTTSKTLAAQKPPGMAKKLWRKMKRLWKRSEKSKETKGVSNTKVVTIPKSPLKPSDQKGQLADKPKEIPPDGETNERKKEEAGPKVDPTPTDVPNHMPKTVVEEAKSSQKEKSQEKRSSMKSPTPKMPSAAGKRAKTEQQKQAKVELPPNEETELPRLVHRSQARPRQKKRPPARSTGKDPLSKPCVSPPTKDVDVEKLVGEFFEMFQD